MSFLDESSATLLEALAFIDAHESPSDSRDSGVQRRPRKSPKLGYWERLKAESESLREEAATLGATLKQLQLQLQVQATAAGRVDREQWMLVGLKVTDTAALAELENQRRLEAESLNHQLKDLVARNIMSIEILTSRVRYSGTRKRASSLPNALLALVLGNHRRRLHHSASSSSESSLSVGIRSDGDSKPRRPLTHRVVPVS